MTGAVVAISPTNFKVVANIPVIKLVGAKIFQGLLRSRVDFQWARFATRLGLRGRQEKECLVD